MGSIPVRSTKKHQMQSCIRCFLILFLVNPSSVRQYGKAVFLPRVSRLRETANSCASLNEDTSFSGTARKDVVLFPAPIFVPQTGFFVIRSYRRTASLKSVLRIRLYGYSISNIEKERGTMDGKTEKKFVSGLTHSTNRATAALEKCGGRFIDVWAY